MRIRKWDVTCHLQFTFLHSHLNFVPENLGEVSDDEGERFHQDIQSVENCYQSSWKDSMMADYCWMLYRDAPDVVHQRNGKSSHFYTRSQNREKRLFDSSCLSVLLYARSNSASTGQIFMKFYICVFFNKCL